MKKLLACILILTLLLGSAIAAAAALPVGPPDEIEIAPHSLVFELPVVTGIEAVWNDEIFLDDYELDHIWFGPENVAVTVSFEGGPPQVLTSWWGEGWDGSQSWWWEIHYRIDHENNTVTLFYLDSNSNRAFWDAYPNANWEDFLQTLPQTSFAFPANYRELFFDSFRPFAPLALNQPVNITGEAVFTFTTQRDGLHRFVTPGGQFHVVVFDADFAEVVTQGYVWQNEGSSRHLTRTLEAGATYHVFVRWVDEPGELVVIAVPLLTVGYDWLGLNAGADSVDISIRSDTGWTVTTDHDWITTSVTGGTGDGSFRISVTANNTGSTRIGTVTVRSGCGTVTRSIHVWQLARPNLWQRIVNAFWDVFWTVESWGFLMSQSLIGRIVLAPFMAIFVLAILPYLGIQWIRFGGWFW